MRESLAALLCAVTLFCFNSDAQVFSTNIVGYINRPFAPGNTLFASQLSDGTNTLSSVFASASIWGGVPEGTTVALWDPITLSYTTASEYSSGSGWSIDYSISFGEGALLSTPLAFTNTFVGSIIGDPNLGPYPHTGLGDGYYLLGNKLPIAGNLSDMFDDIIGRPPEIGEQYVTLDMTYTYLAGGWTGDPLINVTDAGFFNLGPVVIPEPTTFTLLGLSSLALVMVRRRR